ncbi:MAG: type II toxin-antitoxin system PemK/MazF family toxin [Chloroflexota bacterium]|nr:type II toxin-antitoxin system PemK/MazF family toxin [Chloroflexota bacterium]MDE2908723.1 type II toxin-antitoxin system PemK/MazF family toxin [Chloroflexota bacterium]
MAYLPQRGDTIWVDLDPRTGREQSGHRPALVLSPREYNRKMKVAVCCPITSREQRSEFEVPLPNNLGVRGAVLVYHVRSVDWRAGGSRFLASVPDEIVDDVLIMLSAILDLPGLD